MVSTFTPNLGLEEPARGDDVGVWDVPPNANSVTLDLAVGGITMISLNNSNVVLSVAQARSKTIIFNSTLSGDVAIIFPSTFTKSYEVINLCTGTSAFIVALTTPVANSLFISAPPGELVDINNDGAGNLRYRNFGHIGEYLDIGATVIPRWMTYCGTNNVGFAPVPYLNCDGTTFSSATYPQLANVLGTTTLPDSRGRTRFALNQTTGRITAGISGVNGDALLAAGGNESLTSHNHSINDPGHTHTHNAAADVGGVASLTSPFQFAVLPVIGTLNAALTGISIQNTGAGGSQNMAPAYVGGLTLIRAG
jgi:microcystin-dependent protein